MYFLRRGPEADMGELEFQKYGRNRLAEGKLPSCAEMCATKALLAGDGDEVADILERELLLVVLVLAHGAGVLHTS